MSGSFASLKYVTRIFTTWRKRLVNTNVPFPWEKQTVISHFIGNSFDSQRGQFKYAHVCVTPTFVIQFLFKDRMRWTYQNVFEIYTRLLPFCLIFYVYALCFFLSMDGAFLREIRGPQTFWNAVFRNLLSCTASYDSPGQNFFFFFERARPTPKKVHW